jgi:hypothetical protein
MTFGNFHLQNMATRIITQKQVQRSGSLDRKFCVNVLFLRDVAIIVGVISNRWCKNQSGSCCCRDIALVV